jgi:hypothetical protein
MRGRKAHIRFDSIRIRIGSIIGVDKRLGNLKVDNGSEDQKKTNRGPTDRPTAEGQVPG